MIHPDFLEPRPPRATSRELRQFAGLCVLIFGGLFVMSVVRHGGWPSRSGGIAGAVALLVGLPGLVRPEWVRPVYLTAITLTRPIGHFIGTVVLAAVYFGIITPLGVAFRLIGRDALSLRRRQQTSYWLPRNQSDDVRLYLRQFQPSTAERKVVATGGHRGEHHARS